MGFAVSKGFFGMWLATAIYPKSPTVDIPDQL
jgi:hypothetical protein